MITPQNKIIIVDDDKSELETLTKAFLSTGVGCRPFEYEIEYNTPLNGIRLAFFDLNLTTSRVNSIADTQKDLIQLNTAVFNDLAIAINQYISKENGPYALIFWTKNKKVIQAFIEYMQDPTRGFSDTASPFFIGELDKSEINNDNILEKLSTIFEDDKIKFYFDFEEKARIAGSKTIDKLHSIIPKDEKWGDTVLYFENIDKVLSKIAITTIGFDYAKEKPEKGIYDGLIQIMNNEIINSSPKINKEKLIPTLTNAMKFGDVKFPCIAISQKLNTIFHIDYERIQKDDRGVVLNLDKKNNKLIQTFGITNLDEWIIRVLAIKDNKTELIKKIKKDSKFIAIEFSSACDYSQKKDRANKYILGVLIPEIDFTKDVNTRGRIESSYHIGGCTFYYENSPVQICLDLNFVIGTTPQDSRLGDPLFSLNKEIIDMLGNKYASHVSRIGITSF
ncbi:hypothetical protein HSX10_04575 [Winogradskyella undariae]|uniref:hypothetical protein n=1 Tax=Winogradskyella undariae TaxID=1285465 RepID=UPI00156AE38F|nr:hypothetical protein [Winogradskyella undariae]NRR90833.1 hypothetical protein [Winogradskyella undariae]